MSLIALIATSVSAYAVSSRRLATGATFCDSSSSSIPVFSGIRWSLTISATGSLRNARAESSSSAWAADVADSTRYAEPYWRLRSRVIAADTCGSSSTVKIVGRLIRVPPITSPVYAGGLPRLGVAALLLDAGHRGRVVDAVVVERLLHGVAADLAPPRPAPASAWQTTDSASILKKRRAAGRVSAKPKPSAPRAWNAAAPSARSSAAPLACSR